MRRLRGFVPGFAFLVVCALVASPSVVTGATGAQALRQTYERGISDMLGGYMQNLLTLVTSHLGSLDQLMGLFSQRGDSGIASLIEAERARFSKDGSYRSKAAGEVPELAKLQREFGAALRDLEKKRLESIASITKRYERALRKHQKTARRPSEYAEIEKELFRLFTGAAMAERKAAPGVADAVREYHVRQKAATRSADEEQPYIAVRVFYATDRKRTGKSDPNKFYGGERGVLEYGTTDVSIPKDHEPGEIERPSWLCLQFSEKPSKHIVLLNVNPTDKAAFLRGIKEKMAKHTGADDFLVFVHGFNNSFPEGVRRTAQIAYDIQFPGTPVCFSWPSEGKLSVLNYTADQTDADWSLAHFEEVLLSLAAMTETGRIHLIGHSMGARVLANTLVRIAEKAERPLFENVILAAADIDAETFRNDIAPRLGRATRSVTTYASSNDRALKVSNLINGAPRLGDSGRHLVVADDLDTVDASGIDIVFLGSTHCYFSECDKVLSDLRALIMHGLPPPDRLLEDHYREGKVFWAFAH